MTEEKIIQLYQMQILTRGGGMVEVSSDPEARPMAIAKLQDIWRKLD